MPRYESASFTFLATDILSDDYSIKEALRRKFADLANSFEQRLRTLSSEISAMDGPLEVLRSRTLASPYLKLNYFLLLNQTQQRHIQDIQERLSHLKGELKAVSDAEDECVTANVEENDYTVFTGQDLAFELELVVQVVGKKIAFIDNQVCPLLCISCCWKDNPI